MQILHIVHQFPPEHIGGTEFYTQWLTQAQLEAGHEVAVFHRRSGAGEGLEKNTVNHVPVWSAWAGEMTPSSRFRSTFNNHTLSSHFSTVLAEFRPDLVHIQHLMGLPYHIAQQLKTAQIPYVVTLHDYFYFCANAQLITNYDDTLCSGPKAWVNCGRCTLARAGLSHMLLGIPPLMPLLGWRNFQLKQVLNEAVAVIAPTQFVKDIYVKQGVAPSQIVVIQHGIAPPDETTQLQALQKEALENRPLQVIYVGGISPQKGVDLLITAVNQFSPEQIRCNIYGDLTAFPDYVNKIERMISDEKVSLNGRLSRQKLWQALLQADVLVVPARWHETSSLIIDEAFAVKLPVIVSKLGGMTEKVAHGVNGFHMVPDDANNLAQHLRQIIQNPERLVQLSSNIEPVKTIQQHSQEVEELYRKFC